jgi:hypothetical protein
VHGLRSGADTGRLEEMAVIWKKSQKLERNCLTLMLELV